MLTHLLRHRWYAVVIGGVLLVVLALTLAVTVGGGSRADDALVIYNGRSHYGTEQVFLDFERETGIEVSLRGGTAPELFERLRREGEDTPADLLVTTDLANLWRAQEAGLLAGVDTEVLRDNIPPGLHDDEGEWWALTTRLRIPVVSTERVDEGEVTRYEDLGDPRFEGRTCLRTSTSEYNQSLVADMLAKRGYDETEALLRSWMANEPEVLGSDGELLALMAAGECDLGLSNHYYLGRALEENPAFPVAPAWPDQDGAGAHANVSGMGLVQSSDRREQVVALMEYLTSPGPQAQIASRSEFAAHADVPAPEHIADWGQVTIDPIAVEEAGPLLGEAIKLMLEVGWR
ncbi:MAG: extracellular solute-binding protein [Egibacteraceae bacterium]